MVAIFGWRIPFIVCGLIGLVWAVTVVLFIDNDPEKHKKINKLELSYIRDGQVKKEGIDKIQPMSWYKIVEIQKCYCQLCLGFFFSIIQCIFYYMVSCVSS